MEDEKIVQPVKVSLPVGTVDDERRDAEPMAQLPIDFSMRI